MSEQSAEYFVRRERAERSAAASASSPVVRDIHLKMAERYAIEAEQCRRDARRYDGKPEQQFLLQAASAYEELAAAGHNQKRKRERAPPRDLGASTARHAPVAPHPEPQTPLTTSSSGYVCAVAQARPRCLVDKIGGIRC